MDGEERGYAPVDAGQFVGDEAGGDRAHRCAPAVAEVVVADNVERRKLRDQLERELTAFPVLIDDRQDFRLAESPDLGEDLLFLFGQLILHQEVVGLPGKADVLDERGGGWIGVPGASRLKRAERFWRRCHGCSRVCVGRRPRYRCWCPSWPLAKFVQERVDDGCEFGRVVDEIDVATAVLV